MNPFENLWKWQLKAFSFKSCNTQQPLSAEWCEQNSGTSGYTTRKMGRLLWLQVNLLTCVCVLAPSQARIKEWTPFKLCFTAFQANPKPNCPEEDWGSCGFKAPGKRHDNVVDLPSKNGKKKSSRSGCLPPRPKTTQNMSPIVSRNICRRRNTGGAAIRLFFPLASLSVNFLTGRTFENSLLQPLRPFGLLSNCREC